MPDFDLLDPVLLARIQFAFTIAFHIIFPAFTIGLASWLAVVEGLWLKTGNDAYRQIYKLWVKIFAVAFAMGVVSGVVMSYQIGTNWSVFSDKVANVIGPLFAYEVLTAFFLEGSFLGVMLFGWGRVSKTMHFLSTLIVAVGTLISAFWILSANSWMQTPQGYEIGADGLLYPLNWLQVIFNPSFPFRLTHMVIASYLTTAFVVGSAGAWYLLKGRFVAHARIMFGMAMLMAAFVAPVQLIVGDLHGLNTLYHQPVKVAAMEGNWDIEAGQPLTIFALPDEENEINHYEIAIPKLGSFILTHEAMGKVPYLKAFPDTMRPPVTIVFFAFRIMVGLGLLMIATGCIAGFLYFRRRLFTSRVFHRWCFLMGPAGFVAMLAGWFVTEVGRQPWVAYNIIRTQDAVSPVLGQYVALSLAAFICVYMIIFGAGSYYIIRLIRRGPNEAEAPLGVHEKYQANPGP